MEPTPSLHHVDSGSSVKRCSIALLLLMISGLLNACGGGASEPGAAGGGTAVACVTGSASTVLIWDAVAGAAGYNVYFRTSGGAYSPLQDAGPSTTLTVTGLTSGTTYYFVATAYDSSSPRSESNFSNAVCKTVS